MSLDLTFLQIATSDFDTERGHRFRVRAAYWISVLSMFALFVYGMDYYLSNEKQRAIAPKHDLLKPGGTIGLTLGIVGFVLFVLMFMYPLRLRWGWLARQGSSKRWLDFHILLGLVAPLVITFHATFKFHGIAGTAYWTMLVVALSGLIGRYIYSQIPRTLSDAELTFKDGQQQIEELAWRIKGLGVLLPEDVDGIFHLPELRQSENISLASALCKMVAFDFAFPYRMWRFRRKVLWRCSLMRFGRSPSVPIQATISAAREQALLSKRVFFLSKSRQMLKLWHVIHRPFSYSFALLALLHVVLMLVFGYY
jgi:hypothetical protein